MREEGVALEHHRRATGSRRPIRDILVAEEDVADRHRLVAGDHAQRRGLAAAGWSQQATIGSGGDLERDVVNGEGVAIFLGDGNDFEIGGTGHRSGSQVILQHRQVPCQPWLSWENDA